jgi:hypothetical protein
LDDPLEAYAASVDPDVMYLHEAMKQPDRKQFKDAMTNEITDHTEKAFWSLFPKENLAANTKIIPMVWAMRRKRRIATGEIYKWKARLNVDDGSKQTDYVGDTYAPVAAWPTIRLCLTLTLLEGWETRQLDYVLAYPQAPTPEGEEIFLQVPKGFEVDNKTDGEYVLKLHNNVYGTVFAGKVWYDHLVERLQRAGFKRSNHDD